MSRKYSTSDEAEKNPLDTHIGPKAEHRTPAAPRKKTLSQGLKEIYYEFCSNTSLHGVQYLGQRRPMRENYFWICVFVISIYFCSITICSIYQKWNDTPVIVSFSETSTPVSSIPFPAITICSESKREIDSEGLQLGELYTKLDEGEDLPSNMTSDELEQLVTLMHICQLDLDFDKINITHGPIDYIKILNEMSVPLDLPMVLCTWAGISDSCDDLFTTTYTDEGVCYTFNGFNGTDLYRNDTVQYQIMGLESRANMTESRLNRTLNWSLERGYPRGIPLKTYPARVVSASSKSAFSPTLMIKKQNLDYACSGPTQGFKVAIHTPDDVPLMSKRFVRVSLDKEVSIAVKPIMITTSEGIADYKPEKRKCYLAGERELKFFKVYSERNCEQECLTNYTLKRCGCVKFSMPRTPEMPVCGANNIQCYTHAEEHLLLDNFADGDIDDDGCNCMPSCTSLEYDTEISQADYDFKQMLEALKNDELLEHVDLVKFSSLTVYFKDNEFITSKRSELFGFSDFLANCGGVLGLFMGFSFLSAVEVLYHWTIRLWTNMSAKRNVN